MRHCFHDVHVWIKCMSRSGCPLSAHEKERESERKRAKERGFTFIGLQFGKVAHIVYNENLRKKSMLSPEQRQVHHCDIDFFFSRTLKNVGPWVGKASTLPGMISFKWRQTWARRGGAVCVCVRACVCVCVRETREWQREDGKEMQRIRCVFLIALKIN